MLLYYMFLKNLFCYLQGSQLVRAFFYQAGGWGAGRWRSGLSLWHDHHLSCRTEFQAKVTNQKEDTGHLSLPLLFGSLFFLFTENSCVLLYFSIPDSMFLEGNAIHGQRPWKPGEPGSPS